jgi:hypothetical protein
MDDAGVVHVLHSGFDGTNPQGLYYAMFDGTWDIEEIVPDEFWQIHDFAEVDGEPYGLVQVLNSDLFMDYVYFLYHDGKGVSFQCCKSNGRHMNTIICYGKV